MSKHDGPFGTPGQKKARISNIADALTTTAPTKSQEAHIRYGTIRIVLERRFQCGESSVVVARMETAGPRRTAR